MNHEDMTRRSEDPSDQAKFSSTHATGRLALLGALAASALASKALTRYKAYKEVLLTREQDEEAIVSTLTLFIRNLSECR